MVNMIWSTIVKATGFSTFPLIPFELSQIAFKKTFTYKKNEQQITKNIITINYSNCLSLYTSIAIES